MIKRIIYTSLACIFAASILLVSLLYLPQLINGDDYEIKNITQWSTVDGEQKIPLSLKQDDNGVSKISTVLPADLKDNSHLCFWSYLSSVTAYVDGEEIYRHSNTDGASFCEAAYSRWNYLSLPDDAAGKTLTIEFYSPYSDIDFRLNEAMLGNMSDIHMRLHARFAFSNFIEIVLVWIALLFIVLGFLQNTNTRFKKYQLYAGLFLLMYSLYMRTGQKALPLNALTPFSSGFICYFCMFGMSIPLTLYIREKVLHHTGKVTFCNLLALAQAGVMAVAFILHGFAIVDIHYMLSFALLLLLISIVSAIVFSVESFVRHKNAVALFTLLAPVIMLFVIILECFQFYYTGKFYFETGLVCRLGAALVIVIECVLYVYHLKIEARKLAKINEDNINLKLQVLTENIQPHFILNTIGAIRTIIPDEPTRASDLLLDFSKYIRKKLEHKDYFKLVPFAEELEHIKTYLKLEEARFGDTIEVVYDIRDSAFRVLPLTIQPFVENAVKHGLVGASDGAKLSISSFEGIHCHVIEIMDNGVGFDASDMDSIMENRKSVGLKSAIMRLENQMKAKITIRSRIGGKGTRVHIEIPATREKNENDNSR